MLVADHAPSVPVHRHRSRRSHRRSMRTRILRKAKTAWRRTKLRNIVLTVVLATGAVVGGYKMSMLVIDHQLPESDTLQQFQTSANKSQ
jgi:hypothetical protein